MLGGTVQLAPFAAEFAHGDMHVGGTLRGGLALLRRQPQPPFERGHRLAELALRGQDVGQIDRAVDRVGDIAGAQHPRHAVAVSLAGGFEVALRPGGETQQRLGRTIDKVVVRRDKRERPLGVFCRGWRIAAKLGDPGAVDRDRRRDAPFFVFVRDNKIVGLPQPPFGRAEPRFGSSEVAAGHHRPRLPDVEHGTAMDRLGRQRLEPAEHGRVLTAAAHGGHGQLDQHRRSLRVMSRESVADRLGSRAVALMPVARARVEVW